MKLRAGRSSGFSQLLPLPYQSHLSASASIPLSEGGFTALELRGSWISSAVVEIQSRVMF